MTEIQQLLSAECPQCGEEADLRVVGFEFGLDVSPGREVRTCIIKPQDRNEGGGAVYVHIGEVNDD